MFRRLLSLIGLAIFLQSGANIYGLRKCRSKACAKKIVNESFFLFSNSVRPISIFPEEAKRFR